MSKIRVYELAKELGLDNKEIMAKLRQLKLPVKSHMSVLPDEELAKLKQALADADAVVASGGVEEKRVATGVIRRRARPLAASEEEEKQPKVDLLLKQAPKRTRAEEEEDEVVEHLPEPLAGIPKEWTEEELEEEARAEAAEAQAPAEPEEPETVEEPPPPPEPAPPPPAHRAARPEAPPAEAPRKSGHRAERHHAESAPPPEAAAEVEVEAPAAPEPESPRVPVVRKMYIKPFIRKTARAVEGEPLPMPGRTAAPAPGTPAEQAAAEDEDKKKRKKKKKKKGEEAVVENGVPAVEPPKRRLRRKIAFKVQRGAEGMEIADAGQMYQPSKKKVSGKKKVAKKTIITTPRAQKRIVRMGETILVVDLAHQLEVKSQEIIRLLAKDGAEVYEGTPLDVDTATLAATAFEYEIMQVLFDENKVLGGAPEPAPESLVPRPPVVTVMGHVDHGKTSLLDTIRKTRVTEEEAGAITQAIGASVVETSSGRIVFIDTPGHEAFTHMRARGAKITDIVVLVVASDDGIMPQTLEAKDHAQAAGVPIIVAINKIDLPQANPQAVKQRLAEIGLQPEEWGGDTIVIECSAKTGLGVPDLLESILLQAEVLELTADPNRPAKCFVIESRLDKGRGPVATVVVQEGTLRLGNPILCGTHHGKVRAMLDDRGQPVTEAGPSTPVEIMGLDGVPEPGEVVVAVAEERNARTVAEHRLEKIKSDFVLSSAPAKVSLESLMARLEQGELQNLNLIIKTDTNGSAEAIRPAVEKLSLDKIKVAVLHVGVGTITENDVLLASASTAVILGFNVKPEAKARKLAEQERVQIRTYDVIYHLLDDVKASLLGMLKPVVTEEVIGAAEVRKVFRIQKVGAVAGCLVTSGVIKRSARARVRRAGEPVFTGRFKSLKRQTEDAREVAAGLECGIAIDNFNNFEEGDIIEAFEVSEK